MTRATFADATIVPLALAPTADGSVTWNVFVVLFATVKLLPLIAHVAVDGVPAPADGGHTAPESWTVIPLVRPWLVAVVTVASVAGLYAVGVPVDVPGVTPVTGYVNVLLPVFVTANVPLVPTMLEPLIMIVVVPLFGRPWLLPVVTVTVVAVATSDATLPPSTVPATIVLTGRSLLTDVTVTAAGLMPNWLASLVMAVFVESNGVVDSAVPVVVRQAPVHV